LISVCNSEGLWHLQYWRGR